MSVVGFGCGIAPNYYVFMVMRLCSAIAVSGFTLSSFVLSVEVVGHESRNFAGLVGTALFSFAYSIVALAAYFVREWRYLMCLFSGAGLLTLPLLRLVWCAGVEIIGQTFCPSMVGCLD
jgi:OCT family organic cation transporter-like MFS transporter 4/5